MATSKSKSKSQASASASSQTTTDHDEIRQWVESRGGKPACVIGTGGGGDAGVLRIDFPGYSGEESLQPMDWDEWFQKFDENNLAFLYQETTSDGERSNFNKLISRDSQSASGSSSASSSSGKKKSGGERHGRSS